MGVLIVTTGTVLTVDAIEEPPYVTEKREGDFEVRLYEPRIVAEVKVEGAMEEAGNKG